MERKSLRITARFRTKLCVVVCYDCEQKKSLNDSARDCFDVHQRGRTLTRLALEKRSDDHRRPRLRRYYSPVRVRVGSGPEARDT